MEAVKNNDVNVFDKLLFKYIGYVGSNKVCSFWLGLMCGLISSMLIGDVIKCYYQYLNCLSVNFVLFFDVLMVVLGGSLKCCECILVCLGDILSQFYFVFVVLKCYDDEGCNEVDLLLVYWGV